MRPADLSLRLAATAHAALVVLLDHGHALRDDRTPRLSRRSSRSLGRQYRVGRVRVPTAPIRTLTLSAQGRTDAPRWQCSGRHHVRMCLSAVLSGVCVRLTYNCAVGRRQSCQCHHSETRRSVRLICSVLRQRACLVEELLLSVEHDHRNPTLRKVHRNPAGHQPRADQPDLLHHRGLRGQPR